MRSRKTGGPKAGPGRQHKWDSTNKTVEVDGWIWHHLKRYDHLNKVFGCILDTELRKLPLVWPCKVHVCRSRRLPCQRINLTKLLLGILPCTWSPLDFNKTSHDRTCQEFPVPGSFGWSGSLQKTRVDPLILLPGLWLHRVSPGECSQDCGPDHAQDPWQS